MALTVVAALAIPTAASANNGKGNRDSSGGSCTVSGNMVYGQGLPDELLNFMVEDASGSSGWVLGTTSSGEWAVNVPDRAGDTTYKFISRTRGKDGKRYTTFAACHASA